ncbi:hypothetical protein PIB30_064081 [Stylosanthes scabra]|uniref:PB1-like domain-containing protein n=1 Tax=Stylosanthes scabra TaxID=79078 RepID=A0ABU6VMK0_9FABA|nr:hypothetical protein [Stylosanthes scabra]
MAFFDITLFHKGYFGYEDGHMKYMGGEKLIVQEQDSDLWSVFEVEEQLRRLGNRVEDIATLWYKDPEVEQLEVGLTQFANDRDAINMVNLGLTRGSVELYVVYEGYDDEGIPEIGWMDVGGGGVGMTREGIMLMKMRLLGIMLLGVMLLGIMMRLMVLLGVMLLGIMMRLMVLMGTMLLEIMKILLRTKKRVLGLINSRIRVWIRVRIRRWIRSKSNEEDIDTDDGEDSDDGEYIPEEEVTDSADDIHFTDSDDELDLNDNGFGGEGLPAENANADKGKRVVNDDFHGDDGEECDDMEGCTRLGVMTEMRMLKGMMKMKLR